MTLIRNELESRPVAEFGFDRRHAGSA